MKMKNAVMTHVVKIADNHNSGADSYFVKLDENVAIKLFMSPLMRDRNFDRHKEFAPVAPKVGGKMDCKFGGVQMYGFTVEICEVYGEIDDCKWESGRQKIHDWIKSNGMTLRVSDLHCYNLGRTKDGRPVIIDFSRFRDEDGFMYHNLKNDAYGYIDGRTTKIKLTKGGTAWKKDPQELKLL